jgi:hypothetical protein
MSYKSENNKGKGSKGMNPNQTYKIALAKQKKLIENQIKILNERLIVINKRLRM